MQLSIPGISNRKTDFSFFYINSLSIAESSEMFLNEFLLGYVGVHRESTLIINVQGFYVPNSLNDWKVIFSPNVKLCLCQCNSYVVFEL